MSTANMELTEPQVVIHIISAQILAALKEAASEQRWPSRSGDEMDDHIKSALDRAAALTKLRFDYEVAITGVLSRV
jgi:hypothetical protein